MCQLIHTFCCPWGVWEIQCSSGTIVFACLCDSQMERDHSFINHGSTLLRRKGTIYFVKHNKNTPFISPPRGSILLQPPNWPSPKTEILSKHSNQKEWENYENVEYDYRPRDWVPLNYHLKPLSLFKHNQVSGQHIKKEICNVTRILTLAHDRNVFLTLKEMLLSKDTSFQW